MKIIQQLFQKELIRDLLKLNSYREKLIMKFFNHFFIINSIFINFYNKF